MTLWQSYGHVLWCWTMPPGALDKFMISSGQSGSSDWKSCAYLKRPRSCSHLFYQLSITIWRTIAWLGTSPTVAHCIQVIMIFLHGIARPWICLSSSRRISTHSAWASQTASASGAQIKDLCFPQDTKRPRRSSHREACFGINSDGTWNMHIPDLSPNYLIHRIRVCIHPSCCNPVRAPANTNVVVGRAISN